MDEHIPPAPHADGSGDMQGRMRPAERKHMGIATSDPMYLPPVHNPNAPKNGRKARVPVRKTSYGAGGSAQTGGPTARAGGYVPPSSPMLQVRANEGGSNITPGRNYISQPKKGHAIFTSRENRKRKRLRTLLIVLSLATIALALVWFFLLR